MHHRASRCRLPIFVVDRRSLAVVALYRGGWWRLVMLDFHRCRCCRCRCRCHRRHRRYRRRSHPDFSSSQTPPLGWYCRCWSPCSWWYSPLLDGVVSFQGRVVAPKPALGTLRPDVGRHAGVGWRGGQLDGMDDGMKKTNHDFHRGSWLRRTRWASHSFGPPLCFSLPHSSIERA